MYMDVYVIIKMLLITDILYSNSFILGEVQLHKIDTTNPFSTKKKEIRRIKEIKGRGKTKAERTRNL